MIDLRLVSPRAQKRLTYRQFPNPGVISLSIANRVTMNFTDIMAMCCADDIAIKYQKRRSFSDMSRFRIGAVGA